VAQNITIDFGSHLIAQISQYLFPKRMLKITGLAGDFLISDSIFNFFLIDIFKLTL
jgi:hypothetical protein